MILIEPTIKEFMISDAINTFPDECCGFVFGLEHKGENRTLTDVLRVDNSGEGDKRRRFVISSKDYVKAEEFALQKNLQLLGVYHSHPNHPAIPSEHDRVAAQPYFSYLILSIENGNFSSLRSWKLNDEFQFEEETVGNFQLINQIIT